MVVVAKLLVMLVCGIPGGCALSVLGVISTEKCLCLGLALWISGKDSEQEANLATE